LVIIAFNIPQSLRENARSFLFDDANMQPLF
jgi:hypothetical protein